MDPERALRHDFGVVLIVEDEAPVRRVLVRLVAPRAECVLEAGNVSDAVAALAEHRVDLILLDVRLGCESGLEVAKHAASLVPAPAVVAVSGAASPQEAFALATQGVRAYVAKWDLAGRLDEIASMLRGAPPIAPFVKAQVGVRSMREVQESVRDVMLDQALALEDGNQARAARRLGVTRQAVQQMVRRRDKE